jgi:hypothetical protein
MQKRRIMQTQIFFTMQKCNLQKTRLKETKILQEIITLITNLKFQHKPKYHFFHKSSYENRLIIYYLVGAKIP